MYMLSPVGLPSVIASVNSVVFLLVYLQQGPQTLLRGLQSRMAERNLKNNILTPKLQKQNIQNAKIWGWLEGLWCFVFCFTMCCFGLSVPYQLFPQGKDGFSTKCHFRMEENGFQPQTMEKQGFQPKPIFFHGKRWYGFKRIKIHWTITKAKLLGQPHLLFLCY